MRCRRLPDFTQDFATQLPLSGFTIADDAAIRTDHTDAKTVQDRSQMLAAAVDPTAGPANPLDMANDTLAIVPVFQIDLQPADRLSFHSPPIP